MSSPGTLPHKDSEKILPSLGKDALKNAHERCVCELNLAFDLQKNRIFGGKKHRRRKDLKVLCLQAHSCACEFGYFWRTSVSELENNSPGVTQTLNSVPWHASGSEGHQLINQLET